MVEFAKHRLHEIVLCSMYQPNIVESIALSCYLQGCNDVLQLIEQRPDFMDQYRQVAK